MSSLQLNHPRHLLRLMRPQQWLKNSFVFTGLFFGHAWGEPEKVAAVLLAAAAFSLLSSAVYVFNDYMDRDQDRRHPTKCERPLAAGLVTPGVATLLALGLGLSAVVLGWLASATVAGLLLVYLLLNLGYSMALKHVVILDVFIIATGFMLRILAGTLGVDIAPSQWLLLCGLLLTLFLGFAKRYAELAVLEADSSHHRAVLADYDPGMLRQFLTITASGVILSYSLYTMSPETQAIQGTGQLIYTLPFVIYALLRYLLMLQKGLGGDPVRDLLGDSHLLGAAAGWALFTAWLIL